MLKLDTKYFLQEHTYSAFGRVSPKVYLNPGFGAIPHYLNKIFWLLIAFLSAYYLYRGIKFRFFTDGNLNAKAIWYYAHVATAIAPLIIGPFQFWTWLRLNHVSIHRTMEKFISLARYSVV